MARKRGFFAELQHLNQQAEKRRRQQEAAAFRTRAAAQREAERSLRAAEQARTAVVAATARERDRLEREATRLHVESRMAEAESLNADLAQSREEIDGMLAAALAVDDFVDLEALKVTKVEHPPFQPGPIGVPAPALPEPVYFPEPVYREPPAPGGVFGVKKKHAELIARVRADATPEKTAERVAARMDRQRKFFGRSPAPALLALIDEHGLRRDAGPGVLRIAAIQAGTALRWHRLLAASWSGTPPTGTA